MSETAHSLFVYVYEKCGFGKEIPMENYLLISDAAKAVQVESHVLRYWEEELHLPIRRNELGHRYYTQDDIDRFKNIKSMKERGLQLKAIKMILKNGKLDMLPQGEEQNQEEEKTSLEAPAMQSSEITRDESAANPESREQKAQRLQWIMQQLIRQAVQENNEEMVKQIRESVLKELDYQFRMQEERQEERARQVEERTENYYRQIDELLRKKSGKNFKNLLGIKSEKKKKHFSN